VSEGVHFGEKADFNVDHGDSFLQSLKRYSTPVSQASAYYLKRLDTVCSFPRRPLEANSYPLDTLTETDPDIIVTTLHRSTIFTGI
jgi:hypothetical protein